MGTPLPDIWRKQKELQVSRWWHPRPRRAARVLAWLSLIFRIFRHFPSPLRGWSAPPPGTRTPPMQFLERYKYLTRGDAARCPGTALWTSGVQVWRSEGLSDLGGLGGPSLTLEAFPLVSETWFFDF